MYIGLHYNNFMQPMQGFVNDLDHSWDNQIFPSFKYQDILPDLEYK